MSETVLIIKKKNGYKRYVLGKNSKPLVMVQNRLFRCDDDLVIRNNEGGDAIVIYPVDGTQPYGSGIPVDTNVTMAMIRIARMEKSNGSVSFIGTLNQIKPTYIMYAVVGVLIVYSLLSGGIV